MKLSTFTLAFIIMVLISCNNSRTQDEQKPETPKALEDKSSSVEILSKRTSNDLVDELYSELADKTPELKQLENKIDDLNDTKDDSTRLFNNYNEKNKAYYNSANMHTGQISDSILKNKMQILIANSLSKYNTSALPEEELLRLIETKEMTLTDLHTILKITRTLPLIEKYQQENDPATRSLEGFLHQLSETIKYADTLSKK